MNPLLTPNWITIANVKTGDKKLWQDGAPIPSGWKYVEGNDHCYHPSSYYCLTCDARHLPDENCFVD